MFLLQPANVAKRRDSVKLHLSGYSDAIHLIADIVKVSILALGDGENSGYTRIPSPESNVSGVLSIILDLLPYDEAELLDKIRQAMLDPSPEETEDDFDTSSILLTPPQELSNQNDNDHGNTL